MDQTVDGDVQQDAHTERDVDATTRVPMVHHQHTSGAGSRAQEPLPPEAAGHQVVVGDIPLEPPGFRSRADLLAKLDRTEARVLVIYPATGLLGLGTTQLAAAYARAKLADDWRLVAWVNAAETGSLQAGLAAVAEATGLTDGGSGRDIADAGQAVRHLLETDGDRCLLVFDDVADPEALRPFVPADGTAQVLITSTRQPTANLATAIPVDVFSADEALSFLTGRTGLDDEAGAAAVAAVLGHLPLALALAAPVIRGQRHGYAGYLDRLQTIPVRGIPDRGRRPAVPARRRAGSAAVPGGDPGGRQDGHVHPGYGDHGGTVGGRGPPRATARRRAGGRTGQRRASGRGGPGGPGAGVAERPVAADVQPGRPDRHDAPPGGAGGP